MALPAPGSIAPDLSLLDANGNSHSLAESRSKGPVLLTFFKISCPTCQFALPFVDRLCQKLAGAAVTVWAISQDSPEHTKLFNQEFEIGLPQLFDSEEAGYPVSEAYGIAYVPTAFLVNPGGTISHTSEGWSKEDLDQISIQLATAAGLPPFDLFEPGEDVPEYRPGCASKN